MVRYEERVNNKDESANEKEEPSDQRTAAYPFDSSTNNERIRERSEIIGVCSNRYENVAVYKNARGKGTKDILTIRNADRQKARGEERERNRKRESTTVHRHLREILTITRTLDR